MGHGLREGNEKDWREERKQKVYNYIAITNKINELRKLRTMETNLVVARRAFCS